MELPERKTHHGDTEARRFFGLIELVSEFLDGERPDELRLRHQ